MLKKLVKYGNSNALILDRAILELLNISEGAMVKLHTDGKSLVITPHESIQTQEAFMGGLEKVCDALGSEMEKQTASIQADSVKNQEMEKWAPGTENSNKLVEAFQNITKKYQDEMAKLQSEAFASDVDELAEKHQGDKASPAFLKDLLDLRLQHAPRLADMDKEMKEAQEALGMPTYL